MTDYNTFQDQLIEYFSGSTGATLGPGIINSSLQNTTSDRWKIGYQPAALSRGVDMGATIGVNNSAFIDFNSLNNGTNDYDTRILSVLGEAGVNGRGIMQCYGNRFDFVGNAPNPAPYVQMPSGINFLGGPTVYHAPTNQGRLNNVRQVVWSGNMAPSNPNPSITIQLQDIDTGVPLKGHFTITMGNGYSGTGQSICFTQIAITKDDNGPNPWNWEQAYDKGDNLTNLFVNVGLSNPSYPTILLYNKTADPARYLISGFVYYDEEI